MADEQPQPNDQPENLSSYINASPFYAGVEFEQDYERESFLSDFRYLPQSLQKFLPAIATSEYIRALAQSYSLDEPKIVLLAMVIRYVLSGKVYIKNMPRMLSQPPLAIPENIAAGIFNKLINELFPVCWEDIKKVQIQKFGGANQQKQSQSPPPPTQPGLASPTPNAPPSFQSQPPQNVIGADLPETGGNIINLKQKV